MKKTIKSAAKAAPAVTPTVEEKKVLTDEEKLAQWAGIVCQVATINGGKKFPAGTKCESVEVRLNKYHQPFAVLLLEDGTQEFCNPEYITAIKPMTPARAAAAMALIEENRSATTLIAVHVISETFPGINKKTGKKTGGSICCKHRDWFTSQWIPKVYCVIAGAHEDGKQTLLEVTTWKLKQLVGSSSALDSLVKESVLLEAMLEKQATPAKAKATPIVTPEPKPTPVQTLPAKAVTSVIKRSVLKRSAK